MTWPRQRHLETFRPEPPVVAAAVSLGVTSRHAAGDVLANVIGVDLMNHLASGESDMPLARTYRKQ